MTRSPRDCRGRVRRADLDRTKAPVILASRSSRRRSSREECPTVGLEHSSPCRLALRLERIRDALSEAEPKVLPSLRFGKPPTSWAFGFLSRFPEGIDHGSKRPRFYLDRVARGDCDHRRSHWLAAAGRSIRAGIGSAVTMLEQPQADRSGDAPIRDCERGLAACQHRRR